MANLRFGSICSGIEAASQAWNPLGWKPVFFSEIDKFPSAVLAYHYRSNLPEDNPSSKGVPNYGDITKFKEWPDHGRKSGNAIDVLVGGTPCQSFSVAGLRKGLADPQGNLMFTFGAIAQRYKPRWILWENVPGVLFSNKGRDFGALLRFLGKCGYGFAYRVLDAQYVRVEGFERAVPQRRRRVFVVGYFGDWRPAAAVLSEPEGMFGDTPPRRETQKIPADVTGKSATLGSLCARIGRSISTQDAAQGHIIPFDKQALGQFGEGKTSSTLAARDYKDASDLVVFNSRQDCQVTYDRSGPLDSSSPQAQAICGRNDVQDLYVRRLTPVECERLQGFPDNFTKIPWRNKPLVQCPDGPRYKALGNSMAVNVIRGIGVRIEMTESLLRDL